ncbi:hypothetical protein CHARACLAT_026572 [Characodon lateralis]|uniref:Uncharacterized protein n=1 Tax=Characodon lateralis TaxID=208331 RepID=A0ABU7EZK0_9TELE|nr:hypothetical protein [Characodon lateralis]
MATTAPPLNVSVGSWRMKLHAAPVSLGVSQRAALTCVWSCCAGKQSSHDCSDSLQLLFFNHPRHQTPRDQLIELFHSRYVLVVLGLVCATVPAGVDSGAGRLRSLPVLPRARSAGCPQMEQQNNPASPAGGQRELQR